MAIILFQIIGVLAFVTGTWIVGVRVRSQRAREAAEHASRVSHFLFWLGLVLPAAIGIVYPGLTGFDKLLGVPSLPHDYLLGPLGAVSVVAGIVLMILANVSLLHRGRGTAAFVLTRDVVGLGVYALIRNPMSLGYYLALVGIALLAGSTYLTLAAVLVVIPAHVFNLVYFEELELERRFGQSYRDYRRRVPLLIPGLNVCAR